jgi:hypothetical protein
MLMLRVIKLSYVNAELSKMKLFMLCKVVLGVVTCECCGDFKLTVKNTVLVFIFSQNFEAQLTIIFMFVCCLFGWLVQHLSDLFVAMAGAFHF